MKLPKNKLVLIGGIAVVGVVGYLLYRRSQTQGAAAPASNTTVGVINPKPLPLPNKPFAQGSGAAALYASLLPPGATVNFAPIGVREMMPMKGWR